tara:strand:+ start:986 stop:1222 length:237 start_codon:yes stop_codon:yes gene_type:complete
MSIEKICDIIGNGNEYYTGTEIMDQLHKAGYVVAPRKPNKAMIERGQGCLYCVPINRCEQQATQVWQAMIFVAEHGSH